MLTGPVPVGLAMFTQAAKVVTDHVHPRSVSMATDPVPPSAGKLAELSLRLYAHVPAPWVTVNVLSLIVIVPVREALESCRATLNPTDPF